MKISVISEMDSRALIYPMMQILSKFGKVSVISPKRSMRRLIDGDTVGEFCGISFDLDGSADEEVLSADYIINDGGGSDEADLIVAVVGAAISEQYAYDLEVLVANPITHILKFGKPLPAPKNAPKKDKKAAADEVIPELSTQLSMEERLVKTLTDRKSKWIPIIGIEEMENLEALHKWPKTNVALAGELFRIIGKSLSADEHVFMKEVQRPNEDSIDINPLYIR